MSVFVPASGRRSPDDMLAWVPPERIHSELLKLAFRMGVEVRAEAFDLRVIEGRGGLCWLRGRPIVVMDVGLPLLDKIGVLADALAFFNLEALYVPPALRARIDRRAALRTAAPLVASRAR